MADESVSATGERGNPEMFDVVQVPPNQWKGLSCDQRSLAALSPIMSFALVLDSGCLDDEVECYDVARVLKALVGRAEILLGIPGQSLFSDIHREDEHE